jgi:uncharacterized Fe-S cluster protein YjdI
MSMPEITKKYSNGEITIIWKPTVCIHSTLCWKGEKGLRDVFNPAEKPWIKPQGAATHAIIQRVNQCPSGALSFYYNAEEESKDQIYTESVIEIMQNGPLLIYGNIMVKHSDGEELKKNKVTAFCRCGQSSNKPYCDGTHAKTGFAG